MREEMIKIHKSLSKEDEKMRNCRVPDDKKGKEFAIVDKREKQVYIYPTKSQSDLTDINRPFTSEYIRNDIE
jgi:hypothetical protein